VGKPSVPLSLNPDGVFSLGLKIGRRTADLVLLDITGKVRHADQISYRLPQPDQVFSFLERALRDIARLLTPEQVERIIGIGIATPYELWKWEDQLGARQDELTVWKDLSYADRIAQFSELPVFVENDATAACRAENVFGLGSELENFAYFFVAAFIGGGIVLNRTVLEGATGNAGALGSLPVMRPGGGIGQLIDTASIHTLGARLASAGHDDSVLTRQPLDWRGFDGALNDWIAESAEGLAQAIVSVVSVIDTPDIVIDGAMPDDVRDRLVEATRRQLDRQDLRGINPPRVHTGTLGLNARAIGAAAVPVYARYLLNAQPSAL
jgi:predicted NBD/HSP70 family sugar kinase